MRITVNLDWTVVDGDDYRLPNRKYRNQIEYKCNVTAVVEWYGDRATVEIQKVEVVEVVLYARPSFDRGVVLNADSRYLESLVPFCFEQLDGSQDFIDAACKESRRFAESC